MNDKDAYIQRNNSHKNIAILTVWMSLEYFAQ